MRISDWSSDVCSSDLAHASDVSQVIGFAREHGFDIAVRGGGHSSSGHGTVDGGIVIDLRDLNDVAVDEASKTVWVGGGATRTEARRVGNECVSKCRSRWSPYHYKKKQSTTLRN